MYKMMTAKQVIDLLFDLPKDEREIFFTFDDADLYPELEPSGWHGIKITTIFDEFDGVLAIGYCGGGSTVAYDIYGCVDDSDNRECVKEFCTKKLQEYMDNDWDGRLFESCPTICVEIEEEV